MGSLLLVVHAIYLLRIVFLYFGRERICSADLLSNDCQRNCTYNRRDCQRIQLGILAIRCFGRIFNDSSILFTRPWHVGCCYAMQYRKTSARLGRPSTSYDLYVLFRSELIFWVDFGYFFVLGIFLAVVDIHTIASRCNVFPSIEVRDST